MSVPDVLDRFAEILEAVPGVRRVYAGRPRDIPPSDFPAFVVFTDPGVYDLETEGMSDMAVCTRTYRLLLLAMPWVLGSELDAEAACRPYFGYMEDEFLDRPGLDNPRGQNPVLHVMSAKLLGDSGVVNIRLIGKDYAGVEWRVEVKEYLPRVFA